MSLAFPMRRGIRTFLLCGLALLPLAAVTGAQESPESDASAAEMRMQRLMEIKRLGREARRHQRAGKLSEAVKVMESGLALRRKVFGAAHG